MRILSHGFNGNSADSVQRFAANNRTGAAEEGGVPHVVTVLHQAVEQRAFVWRFTKTSQVAFKRVRREEVVRRLHHRQLLILEEPAHGHLQERARRDVVAVENRHELPFRVFKRVVDVPGFRVFMRRSGDIFDANIFGKLAKFFTAPVIEDPDNDFIFRPVDTQRGVHGIFNYVEIFVVGRDKNIHGRPAIHILRQRYRLAI